MKAQNVCRPTEAVRSQKLVRGEVICKDCRLAVGHPECHLSDEQVWERLTEKLYHDPPADWIAEKWGIAHQIEPPKPGYLQDSRWVLDRGEDANYHFHSGCGWELHGRENDSTGYCYTIHYEPDAVERQGAHVQAVINRDMKRTRERTRFTWSRYKNPVHLPI